jgi:4-hydroxy-tetrahydrodipicolinate reductase
MPLRVAVHGAGKMGRELLLTLGRNPDFQVVGAVDIRAPGLPLPPGFETIPYSPHLDEVLEKGKPQILADFSMAEAARALVPAATRKSVNLVIGTTGLTPQDLEEFDRLSREAGVGVVAAPNFALGAVLMNHLAQLAARHFDYAEIIEMHHHEKLDAPSGTALATARAMAKARGKPFLHPATKKENLSGTRGGELEGIALHSLRLPGLMAHQQVIFGALGQTLSIRHDVISRECYIPGILLAIKTVVGLKGLVYGLEKLLGLGGD